MGGGRRTPHPGACALSCPSRAIYRAGAFGLRPFWGWLERKNHQYITRMTVLSSRPMHTTPRGRKVLLELMRTDGGRSHYDRRQCQQRSGSRSATPPNHDLKCPDRLVCTANSPAVNTRPSICSCDMSEEETPTLVVIRRTYPPRSIHDIPCFGPGRSRASPTEKEYGQMAENIHVDNPNFIRLTAGNMPCQGSFVEWESGRWGPTVPTPCRRGPDATR